MNSLLTASEILSRVLQRADEEASRRLHARRTRARCRGGQRRRAPGRAHFVRRGGALERSTSTGSISELAAPRRSPRQSQANSRSAHNSAGIHQVCQKKNESSLCLVQSLLRLQRSWRFCVCKLSCHYFEGHKEAACPVLNLSI